VPLAFGVALPLVPCSIRKVGLRYAHQRVMQLSGGTMRISRAVTAYPFAILLSVGIVSQARAVPLAPVDFFLNTLDAITGDGITQTTDHKVITGFGTYTANSSGAGATATATATLSGGNDPMLSAQVSATNSGPNSGGTAVVNAGFVYDFRVNGPTTNVNLTVATTVPSGMWLELARRDLRQIESI
jgi:hypothetical protein